MAAGVGIDFGVQDENVYLTAGGEDVVEAAEANVIGPAVTAHNPNALVDEGVGQSKEILNRLRTVFSGEVFELLF